MENQKSSVVTSMCTFTLQTYTYWLSSTTVRVRRGSPRLWLAEGIICQILRPSVLVCKDPVTLLKATNDANKNHLSPTLSFYNPKSPRISQWIHSRLHCQLVKFRFPKQLVEELPMDRGISLWYENVTNTTGSVVYCEVIHLIIHTFLLWALHTSYLQHNTVETLFIDVGQPVTIP